MIQHDKKPAGWQAEYLLSKDGDRFYARVHCWCGSTLSSGEFVPTIREATDIARASFRDHTDSNNHAAKLR